MNLVHYSLEYEDPPQSRPQAWQANHVGKPTGLWVTVETDDGWYARGYRNASEWWTAERYERVFEVRLRPQSNILHLSTAEELEAFALRYHLDNIHWYGHISWTAVAKDYQGILILPYLYDCRNRISTRFYYSWDCASGCIWDAAAIESVTLRRTAPAAAAQAS